MTDDEFLSYCKSHADTPRCGFVPEQIARLFRLAGDEESAVDWDNTPNQVVNCGRENILGLVAKARNKQ